LKTEKNKAAEKRRTPKKAKPLAAVVPLFIVRAGAYEALRSEAIFG
jgi:hypothetical protein